MSERGGVFTNPEMSRVAWFVRRGYEAGMKRLALFAMVAFLTGCSNAPVAGFLDNCFPSKAKCDAAPPTPIPAPDPRPVGDPIRPAPGPKSDGTLPQPDFGPVVP